MSDTFLKKACAQIPDIEGSAVLLSNSNFNYNRFTFNMKYALYLLLSGALLGSITLHAQVVINEIQISNLSTFEDEDGDFEDWFELYNSGNQTISMEGYFVSDRIDEPGKWALPTIQLGAGQHKLIFASGKNRQGVPAVIDHFEVPVYPNNIWRYIVPASEPNANWKNLNFDDSSWNSGPGGIGFGDGDDGTQITPPVTSVFCRTTFSLTNPADVPFMVLNADYDDAFVCYLNGVEIARANIGTAGVPPAFNAFANGEHEATGYQGQPTEEFFIPFQVFQNLLQQGENVLAVQVHNANAFSSDLTGNFRLVLGMISPEIQTVLAPGSIQFILPETHTSFGLSSGETLFLVNELGEVVDYKEIGRMQTDHVLRRSADGSAEWCVSTTASPGEENIGPCFNGYAEQPAFSIQSGHYPASVYLALSTSSPSDEIRVTFDGSIPNETSMLYTAPFAVGGTAVVSARTYNADALPSHVKKNTYLINETDIDIPVVSISTDPDNLWNPETGIHVLGPGGQNQGYPFFGANFWMDWEREAYIEYFDAGHQKQMEGPVGIKIHGGWSRGQAQKSFRIQAKGKYGMETMDYAMIPDKPFINSYKGINLRNGGNDYDNYRFHDALMQRAMKSTEADYMGYNPAVVFLNGEYWGFMEIRENLDQHFVEDNRNIPSNEVTVISHNYMGFNVISGNSESFFELHQFATQTPVNDPDFFDGLSTRLDVENIVDYVIGETYWGNGDWGMGWNNTKFFHDDRPGGKWRYMLMDLDFGMGYASGVNDNYLPGAANPNTYGGQIFGASIQNTHFRNYFINRYADLINTIYQSAKINELAYAMRDEILPIYQRHRERWNTNADGPVGVLNSRLDWAQQRVQGARNVVQNHFGLPGQVNITLNVLPAGAGRIHISTIEPSEEEYPWTGVYFNGVPVKITAIENPGYTFNNWQANSLLPGGSLEQELEMMFTSNLAFTAVFEGAAVAEPLAITELMYNADSQNSSGDWLEIRNNMDVPLNLSGWTLKDNNYFNVYTFPLNTVLEPNTYYVLASDVTAFQAAYPAVTNVMGPLNFAFGNSADEVNLYRSSGVPYINFAYSQNDNVNLRCSDGCGHSRGHLGENLNYSAEQWYLECEGGSPAEAFEPCTYDVIISEVNYDSNPVGNPGDWFELKNTSNQTIDLSNWTFRDRNDNAYTIPSGTSLDAGNYLVLSTISNNFSAVFPTVQNVIGPTGVSLSNQSDAIKLYDAENKLQLSMRYFNVAPWPLEAAGTGKTLEFIEGAGHPCSAASWFAGCDGGSPGAPFYENCDQFVSVEENQAASSISVYPNPSNGLLNILHQTGSIQSVRVFDSRGLLVMQNSNQIGSLVRMDVTELSSGMYLLNVTDLQGNTSLQRIVIGTK
jgi:hypothetical protein